MSSSQFLGLPGVKLGPPKPNFDPKKGHNVPNPDKTDQFKDSNGEIIRVGSKVTLNNPELLKNLRTLELRHANENEGTNRNTKNDFTTIENQDGEEIMILMKKTDDYSVLDSHPALKTRIKEELLKLLEIINNTSGFEVTEIEKSKDKIFATITIPQAALKHFLSNENSFPYTRTNHPNAFILISKGLKIDIGLWSIKLPSDSFKAV